MRERLLPNDGRESSRQRVSTAITSLRLSSWVSKNFYWKDLKPCRSETLTTNTLPLREMNFRTTGGWNAVTNALHPRECIADVRTRRNAQRRAKHPDTNAEPNLASPLCSQHYFSHAKCKQSNRMNSIRLHRTAVRFGFSLSESPRRRSAHRNCLPAASDSHRVLRESRQLCR